MSQVSGPRQAFSIETILWRQIGSQASPQKLVLLITELKCSLSALENIGYDTASKLIFKLYRKIITSTTKWVGKDFCAWRKADCVRGGQGGEWSPGWPSWRGLLGFLKGFWGWALLFFIMPNFTSEHRVPFAASRDNWADQLWSGYLRGKTGHERGIERAGKRRCDYAQEKGYRGLIIGRKGLFAGSELGG